MSDHGARPMMGGICFNDWLIQNGYLTLKEPASRATPIANAPIDWSRTRWRGATAGTTAGCS